MNSSDDAGKTSRRSFTKTIAGAIASLPFVSSFVSAEGKPHSAQETSQKKPGSNRSQERVERTHDTPPPITFENGSFVLERKDEFQGNDIVMNTTTNRKEYRVRPFSGSTAVPAHVKIVDGSGEMLYRNDKAANCLISIELEDRSMVNAKTLDDKSRFVIDVESNKSLEPGNAGNNDKPTSRKRNRRYRHSAGNMRMKEITIKERTKTLYSLSLDDLPDDGADLRVMIWVEPA